MIHHTLKEREELEGELRAVAKALEERADRIAKQLVQMDQLTKEKAEIRRELERLHYQIKDLRRAIERYKEESAKLE